MPEQRVLVISRESTAVPESFLDRQATRRGPRYALASVEHAAALMRETAPSLVVFVDSRDENRSDLAHVLWACSTAKKAVPVVALVESYNTDDALTCFRMGVADYLSLNEHDRQIADVVHDLLGLPTPDRGADTFVARSAGPDARTRADAGTVTARS